MLHHLQPSIFRIPLNQQTKTTFAPCFLSFLMVICCVLIRSVTCDAQDLSPQIVSTAGQSFQNNNTSIDWTLGELAVTSVEINDIELTQGFHQPELNPGTQLSTPIEHTLVTVYPNPTASWADVQLALDKVSDVRIQVYGINGQLMLTDNVTGKNFVERISLDGRPAGMYCFYIEISESGRTEAFQVIKINK